MRLLGILDRLFILFFIKAFLVVVGLIAIGNLIVVMLEMYSYIFGRGESRIQYVLLYYLLTLPQVTSYALPIGGSVATLWVLSQSSRTNELLACAAAGMSPMRLAWPFVFCGLVLTGMGAAVVEYVAPPAQSRAYYTEKVLIRGLPPARISTDRRVYQKGIGNRFYAMEFFDSRLNTMGSPTIVDLYPDGRSIEWRLEARSAAYAEGEGWVFTEALVFRYSQQGKVIFFQEYPTLREAELGRPIERQLERFLSSRSDADRMTFGELNDYIGLLELQGRETHDLETRLHGKLAIPVACLVMAVIMCAHGIRAGHSGVLFSLGGGLIWLASFFALLYALRNLGTSGLLDPVIASWSPIVGFLAIGVVLLVKPRFD